jgi:hypothetical protein
MHPRSSRSLSDRPSFLTWLATNTSGVPRAQARRAVVYGLLLGLLLGLLAGALVGTPMWARTLGVVGGMLGGATLGALGAVLVARLLDWAARWSDPLLGYSGLVRMLLHAGELSLLGAVGGGIGGGIGGVTSGLVSGAIAGGLVGGVFYRLRRLGTVLGMSVGLIVARLGAALVERSANWRDNGTGRSMRDVHVCFRSVHLSSFIPHPCSVGAGTWCRGSTRSSSDTFPRRCGLAQDRSGVLR